MMPKPLVSFSVAGYSAALFENEVAAPDGSVRSMKSVSLRRGYFNKQQNRLEEQKVTINPAELGCVIGLLSEMEKPVVERRENGRSEAMSPPPDEMS